MISAVYGMAHATRFDEFRCATLIDAAQLLRACSTIDSSTSFFLLIFPPRRLILYHAWFILLHISIPLLPPSLIAAAIDAVIADACHYAIRHY